MHVICYYVYYVHKYVYINASHIYDRYRFPPKLNLIQMPLICCSRFDTKIWRNGIYK